MNILSVENLSKSYGEKTLFKNITFSIDDRDKIGLIGINGTGKSTLLKIMSGEDTQDMGTMQTPNGIRIEYLSQNPQFDPNATILEQIFKSDHKIMQVIREYENKLEEISNHPNDVSLQKDLLHLTNQMDTLDAWELESQVKTILTKLGIVHFHQKMCTLSGGQKKRVALCSALLTPCDLLILDEPTNHMDNDTIDWLEDYLKNRKGALFMITHDRYFLDRVVNKTLELDQGNLYSYTGNYTEFVKKKLERENLQSALEQKKHRLYEKELAWIRSGAKARSTKQKARIQRFEELKTEFNPIQNEKLDLCVAHSRLGQKIIEIDHVSKSFNDHPILTDFNYILLKNDRIGIVGKSGIGKSTLLNLITEKIKPDKGSIHIGPTVKIGYFSQESEEMDLNMRAIDYIKEGAEFIQTSDGSKISASQMMERFLFTSDMQWTYIKKLSGGEKRRLYLLRVLILAPNVLVLDEPTNDLDIDTLKILESYMDDFSGVILTVSHDRYFLDRTCNKIFSFEGMGIVTQYTGNYSDFVAKKSCFKKPSKKVTHDSKKTNTHMKPKSNSLKFSYKEKLEYATLDSDIEKLENILTQIEEDLLKYNSDFTKLQELSEKKNEIEDKLLFKMERQEYFKELEEKIKNQNA